MYECLSYVYGQCTWITRMCARVCLAWSACTCVSVSMYTLLYHSNVVCAYFQIHVHMLICTFVYVFWAASIIYRNDLCLSLSIVISTICMYVCIPVYIHTYARNCKFICPRKCVHSCMYSHLYARMSWCHSKISMYLCMFPSILHTYVESTRLRVWSCVACW
jgi:hypothetical protein